MDIKIQSIIAKHILSDFQKYEVSRIDAMGLLESIKLSLFNDSMKKV